MTRRNVRSGDGRGQTTQDFAVGISVFLLSVTAVFLFVPSILTPFVDDVGTGPQADQAASSIVVNLTEPGSETTLNASKTETVFSNWNDEDQVRSDLGVRSWAHVNVTLYTLDGDSVVQLGSTRLTAGAAYHDEPASSSTRIVGIDGKDDCCRLVVKVW